MLAKLRRNAALDAIDAIGYFRRIEWHDTLDSTNRYLARELKTASPLPLPALIVSDAQSSGVGRGNNDWWSPTGCLMFSMAAAWPTSTSDLGRLPLRVGLAVAESLANVTSERPLVKWPNDVYLGDRKVCGILIESSTRGLQGADAQAVSIIGIGINCQVDFSDAPQALHSTAISLHERAAIGKSEGTTPESVLVGFLNQWMAIQQRTIQDPGWMDRAWPEWSWLDGKWIEITQGDRVWIGQARGIDARGALQVTDATGQLHSVLSATVRTISPF